ncbi:MAG: hypothetical protein HYW05_01905 [Candidatus Diapherotrites archaeon]|nr:hypothetical protein [Candidatus Diapherotrites archaeon]
MKGQVSDRISKMRELLEKAKTATSAKDAKTLARAIRAHKAYMQGLSAKYGNLQLNYTHLDNALAKLNLIMQQANKNKPLVSARRKPIIK